MWYILCGILVLTNVVTLTVFFIKQRMLKVQLETLIKEKEASEYRLEMELKKSEIVNLQSQINPHFLYNTLEVIRSEAVLNKDEDAAEMAEALANYFRYNISKRKDVVTLGEELDNIDNYINIQKKRFGKRIAYEVHYHSEEVLARKAMMPKLTLQPLVENSIYHGIEKKAGGGTVAVHVTLTNERLIVQVEDDGPGMDIKTLEEVERRMRGENLPKNTERSYRHGGIAIANIHQRIQMMYGKAYGLAFSSTENVGTEAEVTLPYLTEFTE